MAHLGSRSAKSSVIGKWYGLISCYITLKIIFPFLKRRGCLIIPQDVIKLVFLLPEDLSTYFFFDTERVNSVSERRDVADAVKGLLGLTIIEKAMAH